MLTDLLASLKKHSCRNAFCISGNTYTYEYFSQRVAAISHLLKSNRDRITNRRIGLVCYDSIDTYATIVACWFSGFSYIPLGLQNPTARNITILSGADTSVLVSAEAVQDEEKYGGLRILKTFSATTVEGGLTQSIEQHDEAYILFTSGSTGVPKGVIITHTNISAFVAAFRESGFLFSEDDRCLQMFELTFDVSISSFLPALLAGACVYTVGNEGIKYLNVLKTIRENELTIIQIVPSVISLGRRFLENLRLESVRMCILTGESTNVSLLEIWRKVVPNSRLLNYYGPTEATIYCSSYDCTYESKNHNGMLIIGRPFSGIDLVVVDETGVEVGPGEVGELLISGSQLTEGYLKNEERNREAFVRKLHGGIDRRFYRSGDLCYKDVNGNIFYCGRIDSQVKIQGYRIELSEIESNVRKEFSLQNVVVPVSGKSGVKELILVIESGEQSLCELVLEFLRTKLPSYMVPSKVLTLSQFPVNSSGKTDKIKIKESLDLV